MGLEKPAAGLKPISTVPTDAFTADGQFQGSTKGPEWDI